MRWNQFVRIVALLAVAGTTLLTVACNTVEGAGRDVRKAGGAVEDAAHDAK
jgi:predicted small secreted protein